MFSVSCPFIDAISAPLLLHLQMLPALMRDPTLNFTLYFLLLKTCRRQELRELRLLQKEEHRSQAQINSKHQLQMEQMLKRFEQETAVCGKGEMKYPDWLGLLPSSSSAENERVQELTTCAE